MEMLMVFSNTGTDLSSITHVLKQCAAVTTHMLPIKVPPHWWMLLRWRETCQGQAPLAAGFPDTILLAINGIARLPQSEKGENVYKESLSSFWCYRILQGRRHTCHFLKHDHDLIFAFPFALTHSLLSRTIVYVNICCSLSYKWLTASIPWTINCQLSSCSGSPHQGYCFAVVGNPTVLLPRSPHQKNNSVKPDNLWPVWWKHLGCLLEWLTTF